MVAPNARQQKLFLSQKKGGKKELRLLHKTQRVLLFVVAILQQKSTEELFPPPMQWISRKEMKKNTPQNNKINS